MLDEKLIKNFPHAHPLSSHSESLFRSRFNHPPTHSTLSSLSLSVLDAAAAAATDAKQSMMNNKGV
jgi:hypothetical protein